MSVKNQFFKDMAGKHTIFTRNNLLGGDLSNMQVIAVKSRKAGSYIVTYTSSVGSPCCEVWESKRKQNADRYKFANEQNRKVWIQKYIQRVNKYYLQDLEAKAKAKEIGRDLQVGDVLSASWGYDQTNYNYYEVTALIGTKMVEVRELNQMVQETEYLQGKCTPIIGDYSGEPMRRIAKEGRVKICDVIHARKMEYTQVAGARIYSANHFTSYH